MHNYRELIIWRKGRELVKDVYLLSKKLPTDERFGMISQFQRAAVSVPLNISEGAGRGTYKDFSRFLDMSIGSVNEVETLGFLSIDLEYIDLSDLNLLLSKTEELNRMIIGFQSKLSNI